MRNSHGKELAPWPDKPVYQLSIEGVKVALMPSAKILAWTAGRSATEMFGSLEHGDTGNPWIPSHKNFNSIAKQMFRDGDFDSLLSFRKAKRARKTKMNAAAERLFASLQKMHAIAEFSEARNPDVIAAGELLAELEKEQAK